MAINDSNGDDRACGDDRAGGAGGGAGGDGGDFGGAGGGGGGRVDPVAVALEGVRENLARLAAANAWALRDGELTDSISELIVAERQLAAVRLGLLANLDRRGSDAVGGAASTAAWLRGTQRMNPEQAARAVKLARALDGASGGGPDGGTGDPLAATGAALAAGRIGLEHAQVIARTLAELPAGAAGTKADAEAFLLEQADRHDPRTLGRLAAHLRHVVDPDRGDTLADQEERAVAAREFWLSAADEHGVVHGRFRLDGETGAALRAALDPLTAPRPATPAGPDRRPPARRRGDAFAELITIALRFASANGYRESVDRGDQNPDQNPGDGQTGFGDNPATDNRGRENGFDDNGVGENGLDQNSAADYGVGEPRGSENGFDAYGVGENRATDNGVGENRATGNGVGENRAAENRATDNGFGGHRGSEDGFGGNDANQNGFGDNPATDYGFRENGFGDNRATGNGFGENRYGENGFGRNDADQNGLGANRGRRDRGGGSRGGGGGGQSRGGGGSDRGGGGWAGGGAGRPQLVVTVDLDTLRGELGARGGELADGQVLSAAAVRRLACDAQLIPVVLGSAGQVLDIGRASRAWPEPIRRAITARDRGCSFPGCDRPPSWCDVHHMIHWVDLGDTCVDNGALLCEYHHRLVHAQGWIVQLGPDRHPEFVPPAWVDPARIPWTKPWRQTLNQLRPFRPPTPVGAH